MKIICIGNSGDKLSAKHYEAGAYNRSSTFDLSLKREYTVYGISLWRGLLAYLTIGDGQRPYWYPSDLFEVADPRLPADWYFAFFDQKDETWLNAIWGYKEIMDAKHYDQLADLERPALEIFEMRRREIDSSS